MKLVSICNRVIEFSFYSLFFLVPLVFTAKTSELFEFPKMWLTFSITIVIIFSWIVKMILSREFFLQRTPLDIPIALFLFAHILSTIFSLDPYVSLWGYYTRFNGGLLSIVAYILLYYAFVSNLGKKHVQNIIFVSLLSGFLVALWGLPSHFGWDPTCYIFRGSFDTSCWTDAFKPTIRIFSTLGQPAWLAAYVSLLIPIALAYFLKNKASASEPSKQNQESGIRNYGIENSKLIAYCLLILAFLFYLCLIFTNTKGGFIGFWIANLVFWGGLYLIKLFQNKILLKYFLIFNLSFLALNFIFGTPFAQISKFTLPELSKQFTSQAQPTLTNPGSIATPGAFGGTDSGKIRLIVWRGAINAWKDHPIVGTGVETFAYAYYKYKPIEHNLTSEWDYLYNKAHNEYLNYLTTTGIFGLGSYLSIIFLFLFVIIKKLLNSKSQTLNSKQSQNKNIQNTKSLENLKLENSKLFSVSDLDIRILIIALACAYISILISNFFGFSVVIINLYFFLTPAFVFILGDFLKPKYLISIPFMHSATKSASSKPSLLQYVFIGATFLACSFFMLVLVLYWKADMAYGLGQGLNKSGDYQEGYPHLVTAVTLVNSEPLYRDELSINMATLASALYLQKDTKSANELRDNAIAVNDDLLKNHPNNVVFWKNRVGLFYTLAQGDPENEKNYYAQALSAVNKAHDLAPNDAKISYNLAVLHGQLGEYEKAIGILENTIKLKSNYRDAYFALGLFYNQLATDENKNIADPQMQQKAIQTYKYILKNIDPNDTQVKESLKNWGVN